VQIDEAGLRSALGELASSTCRLHGIQCAFESPQPVAILDNSVATHLYRITQEAVNNATRHGNATRIKIELSEDEGIITLNIADNGTGISAQRENRREGMGLKIMDFRARMIGGQLTLKPAPGGGTVVRCKVPKNNKSNREGI